MVKQRMNALDLRSTVDEMRSAISGTRLLNVYDITPRTYLMKFGAGDRKVQILVEVGVRIHITTFTREKPKVPSQFTLKLRKHVRSWRLDSVDQVGIDRVVDFRFGSQEASFHFIIELFGKGNFVLTDHEYTILMLLRTHKDDDVKIAVKEKYPIGSLQLMPPAPLGTPTILAALTNAGAKEPLKSLAPHVAGPAYVPAAIEHCLLTHDLKPNSTKAEWGATDEALRNTAERLTQALAECWRLHNTPLAPGGVLFKKGAVCDSSAATAEPATPGGVSNGSLSTPLAMPSVSLRNEGLISYDEFSPMELAQYALFGSRTVTRFPSISEAIDKFFFPMEMSKIEEHNEKQEVVPETKKSKFFRDHQRRIDELTNEEEKNRKKGELIMLNSDEVNDAIQLVNMAIAHGITWDKLGAVLRQRRQEGLAVAQMIHGLHLERNTIDVLLMQECDDECAEDDGDVAPIVVEVDIGQTAHANASRYFAMKKANSKKLEKTLNATEKAAAAAERKGQRVAVKAGPAKCEIHRARDPYFFEKFYWFIASTGHVVLCAKDQQQADDLVRRYLQPDDLLVHCDVPGAPPCVVKAIPSFSFYVRTLEEAGAMSVCRSPAWEKKQAVSAWWVYSWQVSKTSPDGEYLGAGVFSVRGKKNFLQAMPLMLAVGVVFRRNVRREYTAPEDSEPIAVDDAAAQAAALAATTAACTPASSSAVPSPPQRRGSPSSETAQQSGLNRQASSASESGEEPPSPGHQRSPSGASSSAGGPASSAAKSPVAGRTPTAFPVAPTNHRLSAKERMRQRAAATTTSSAASSSVGGDSSETTTSRTPSSATTPQGLQPGGAAAAASGMPKTRRQLNKLKKIQKKYGEQDDDDRERAMQLLGNKLSDTQKTLIAAVKGASATGGAAADDGKGARPPAGSKGGQQQQQHRNQGRAGRGDDGDGADDGESSGADDGGADDGGADGEEPRRVTFADTEDVVEAEHEQMRRRTTSFEDTEAQRQQRVRSELETEVPYLTTSPAVGDQLGFAVVMCAPSPALVGARYRIEITPGTERKGAATKQAIHHFSSVAAESAESGGDWSSLDAAVATLLKFVREDAVTQQMPSSIKMHIRGAAAAKNAGAEARHAAAARQQQQQGAVKSSRRTHADPEAAAGAVDAR